MELKTPIEWNFLKNLTGFSSLECHYGDTSVNIWFGAIGSSITLWLEDEFVRITVYDGTGGTYKLGKYHLSSPDLIENVKGDVSIAFRIAVKPNIVKYDYSTGKPIEKFALQDQQLELPPKLLRITSSCLSIFGLFCII